MKKIKLTVNSQKSTIIILLMLNLFQLRALVLFRIKIKEMAHQLLLVELEMKRYRDLQK